MEKLQKLIAQWEKRYFQGYVEVCFATSSFTWGHLTFRKNTSGAPDGEIEFRSIEEACLELEKVMNWKEN